MTINVQFATVAAGISALSISGVNVKDIDTLPEDCTLLCPVFYPRPDGFITDLSPTVQSFGSGGTAKLDLSYTLTYRYLHAPLGTHGLFDTYAGLIAKLELILEAIFANDAITGAVDLQTVGVSDVGPVADPAGNMYHGADISLRVLEFVQ
jgi:hypothetical protein